MANMSYCRFENTSKDLQDCIDAVETMLNNSGKNEYNESLSTSEKIYFEELIELCDTFSNYANSMLETYNDSEFNE